MSAPVERGGARRLRILLTRPAEEAERTRAKLEALGHDVRVAAVIAIEPTGAPWPSGVVDTVVATSAQAFASATCAGVPREARSLMPMCLVGERTLAGARRAGFLGAATVAPTVAALVATNSPRGRLLYLAGRDRKPDLEDAWRGKDMALEVVETYAAQPAALSDATLAALTGGAIDVVLHYSRRSAALFLEEAGAERAARVGRHLALSGDVAAALTPAGLRVTVANRPDEAAMLDRLAGLDPPTI